MPQLGYGPGGRLGFRHEWAQWPSLPHLKQEPVGFLSLLVEGGLEPCRAVAQRWYFTHPCNRWMKCGLVCGCQSSKASGESRPRAHLSFSARSKGGDHRMWACERSPPRIFPPEFWHQNVTQVQGKRERARQSDRKREIIRGKREGDWPLRRTSILPL